MDVRHISSGGLRVSRAPNGALTIRHSNELGDTARMILSRDEGRELALILTELTTEV